MSRGHCVDDAQQMRELGRRLAGCLRAGDLVLLSGRLGAGKTTFTQGLAVGLGIEEPVLSPTFVFARVHRGGVLPLVHADAYRLADAADARALIDDLDLDADLAQSVTVVEWGEGVAEQLSDQRVTVRIEPVGEGERRRVQIVANDCRALP
ncbi:MAG: tRNA (adenosine(37)-N6)-threonylcarbamoyltransferase complex ATPase subunit type 1 TsaE [Mycobacteriales bacterium]